MSELPQDAFYPHTRAEWREWLSTNHARSAGVWLVRYKKSSGKPSVDYVEAVEEALCFGWIDSKAKKLDAECNLQWFSPRKAGSVWARSNKERVEKLIAAGLMTPAGMAKIEAAQKDGSWNALDAVELLEIPPDLEQALNAHPLARVHFDAFPRSARRMILFWIASAKRPETRAKRVEETARLAAQNIRSGPARS